MSLSDFLTGPAPAREPSLPARLGLTGVAVAPHHAIFDQVNKAVEDSDDLRRILALPRRARPSLEQQQAMAREMTLRLRYTRTTPCDCATLNPTAKNRGISPCITHFKPIQGWYLYEAAIAGGALGFIIVGGGKTGIDICLPMVLPNVKTYVVMLPNALVDQFNRDYRLWSQHFKVPNLAGGKGAHDPTRPTLRVLKYSELSRKNFATWLGAMRPDAIGCDEIQALKNMNATRTDRFCKYFEEAPYRVFMGGHSGSLTTRGLEDFSHLSAIALREGSPVPLNPIVAREWGEAINPAVGGSPAPMGMLRLLCKPGERVRDGFRRRLVETLGVITTEDAELGIDLVIKERDPGPVPAVLLGTLKLPREHATRPDGETLVEKVDQVKVCRQLSSGFFYRWRYPHVYDAEGNEVEDDVQRLAVVDKWFLLRQQWARELRKQLEFKSPLMDSPALCEDAIKRALEGYRPALGEPRLPVWHAQCYLPWKNFERRVEYEQETQWIDDFLVRDAAKWAAEGPGVVFYRYTAFGEALGKMTGLPHYASKSTVHNLNPTREMLDRKKKLEALGEWKESAASWLGVEDGTRAVVCSVNAFGTGTNLQSFWRMLMCQSPSDGGMWEQALGRFHREGQPRTEVTCEIYRHTPEVADAFDDAREYAKYAQETTGKVEKLLHATIRLRGRVDSVGQGVAL